MILPPPETRSLARSWQWLYGWPLFWTWSGLYGGIFLLFIFGHWVWLKKLKNRRSLFDDLRERKQKCDKIAKSNQFSLAAAEVVNATYYLLSRLMDQDEFNRDLSDLLESLPPSVRTEVLEPLQKELEVLQTVAFAPAGAWANISSSADLRKHTDRAFQILEQTLRLSEEGT